MIILCCENHCSKVPKGYIVETTQKAYNARVVQNNNSIHMGAIGQGDVDGVEHSLICTMQHFGMTRGQTNIIYKFDVGV
jgi:hypothetical protein